MAPGTPPSLWGCTPRHRHPPLAFVNGGGVHLALKLMLSHPTFPGIGGHQSSLRAAPTGTCAPRGTQIRGLERQPRAKGTRSRAQRAPPSKVTAMDVRVQSFTAGRPQTTIPSGCTDCSAPRAAQPLAQGHTAGPAGAQTQAPPTTHLLKRLLREIRRAGCSGGTAQMPPSSWGRGRTPQGPPGRGEEGRLPSVCLWVSSDPPGSEGQEVGRLARSF